MPSTSLYDNHDDINSIHNNTITKEKSSSFNNLKIFEKKNNNSTNNPSLCIPRIETHLTKKQLYSLIYSKINKLNFGKIKKIDIAFIVKNKTYRVFIHFNYWFINENVQKYKEYLLENSMNSINILYDFPKFWRCFIPRGKPKD